MQEAAEQVAGKNGVPKGPKGTKGIVMLSTDVSWTSPDDDKKNNKKWDGDDDDEGSESSALNPRNLSFSSRSERAMKSPAKRKKKRSAWPPSGEEDEEEEEEIQDEVDDDDDDEDSVRTPYEGIEISINHVNLYEWLQKWTTEYGLPAVTPMGVFNTLCLDDTMDEWLTDIEEVNAPNAWAEDGWLGTSPIELLYVFTYLTILLTIGDLTVESGILTSSQGEMFWADNGFGFPFLSSVSAFVKLEVPTIAFAIRFARSRCSVVSGSPSIVRISALSTARLKTAKS